MSLQQKTLQSPKYVHRKISLVNESLQIKSTRNSSFEIDQYRRRTSNTRFKNTGSVIRGSRGVDYQSNITLKYQQGLAAFRENKFQEAQKLFYDCILVEPMHHPSRYMISVCNFSTQQYEKCLKDLKLIKDQCPKYNKNLYIIMSLAFKKLNQIDQAIQILNDAIKYYDDCYDIWQFKGKLECKLKKYKDAINSLKQAVQLNSRKPQLYISLADCYRLQNQFEQAINHYKIALSLDIDKKNPILLLKVSVCYYEMGLYQFSLQAIDQFISLNKDSSEGNKLKGQILIKLGQRMESQLYFEQAIQLNNSKPAVTKSLIEIAKFKIEEKDFYQLYHTLLRKEYLDVDENIVQPYIIFAEGVLALIKKQYKESEELLIKLQDIELPKIIKEQYKYYLAYAYMMTNRFIEAQQIYTNSNYKYNELLCQGILSFHNYEESKSYFIEALEYNKLDPNIYLGILEFKKMKEDSMSQAIIYFTQATSRMNTSEIHYLLALAYCFTNDYLTAYKRSCSAIEKADENVADHYYLKGQIVAIMGDLLEALSEFTICLGINDLYTKAYLMRSKCYAQLNQMQEAFEDMNQYIQQCEDFKSAGDLLFNNGLYEEALRTYEQEKVINEELQQSICQCLLATHQYDRIRVELDDGIDQKMITIYLQICEQNYAESLWDLSLLIKEKQFGFLFKRHDILFYRGLNYLYLGKTQEAINDFEKSIALTKNPEFQQNVNYNIMLCWIILKKYKYALTQIDLINKSSEDKQIFSVLKNIIKEQGIFKLTDSQNGNILLYRDSIQVQGFECNSYIIYPYFNIPQPKPKSMQIKFDIELIKNLNYLSVELRPQAPWIRRDENGVIFTTHVQVFDTIKTELSQE